MRASDVMVEMEIQLSNRRGDDDSVYAASAYRATAYLYKRWGQINGKHL